MKLMPTLRLPMPAMPSLKMPSLKQPVADDIEPPKKPAFGKSDVRAAIMAKLKGGK